MALQKSLTLDNGLVATDAYHKVTLVEVTAFGGDVAASIRVSTYLDQSRADAGGTTVLDRLYRMPTFDKTDDTKSAHAQIYAYLKTLDDFSGATDV